MRSMPALREPDSALSDLVREAEERECLGPPGTALPA